MFVSLRQASHWIVPLRVNKSFYNSVLDSGIGIALVLFVPGKPGVLGKSIWRGDFGKKPALDLSKSKPEVSKKAQGPKPKQNIKESGTRRSFLCGTRRGTTRLQFSKASRIDAQTIRASVLSAANSPAALSIPVGFPREAGVRLGASARVGLF